MTGSLYSVNNRIVALKGFDQTSPPFAYLFDDFLGTLNTNLWTTTDTAGGGAGNVAFAYNVGAGAPVAGHSGWLRGTTSNNAAGAEEIAGSKIQWKPSRAGSGALVFEARVNLPSVAACNFSMGLVDAVTYGNGTAMNISGTTVIVTTAANGACWVFDTRGTTVIPYGITVDNNVDSAADTTAAVQGTAILAATSYVFRIEMDSSGNAYFYQGTGDAPTTPLTVAGRATAAGTTLATTLLTPYIGMDNAGAANSKSLDIDYVWVSCAR